MGQYNPNRPTVLGEEWVPVIDVPYEPDGEVERGHGFTLAAPATLGMGGFYLAGQPEQVPGEQIALMSVYPAGSEADIGPVRSLVLPCWHSGAASFLTGTAAIVGGVSQHQAVHSPGDMLYVQFSAGTGTATCYFDSDGINGVSSRALLLQGKRILAVNVLLTIAGSAFPLDDTASVTAALVSASGNVQYHQFTSEAQELTQTQIQRIQLGEVTPWWSTGISVGVDNPAYTSELYPWRYHEIARFNRAHPTEIGFVISCQNLPTGTTVEVGYVALEVVYCEENRLAVGARRAAGENTEIFGEPYSQANYVQLKDPTDLGYATLPAGDYTLTMRFASARPNLSPGDRPEVNAARQLYALRAHPGVEVVAPFAVGDTVTVEDSGELPHLSLHATQVSVSDAFARVSVGGWGNADSGQPWFTPVGTFSVNGGQGRHEHGAGPTNTMLSYVDMAGVQEAEALVTASMDRLPTSGSTMAAILFRRGDNPLLPDEQWMAGFRATPGDANLLAWIGRGWTMTGGVTLDTGIPKALALSPDRVKIRARLVQSTVYVKVWFEGDPEPLEWTYAFSDTGASRGSGSFPAIGVASYTTTANTISFFDDFEARTWPLVTEVHVYGRSFAAPVYDNGTGSAEVAQGVIQASGAAAVDYSQVRFYGRRFGADSGTLHVLVAGVESASVTSAEFDELPEIVDGWREVTLPLAPVVSVSDAGTALQVEFQPDAGTVPAEARWEILAADAPVEDSYTGQVSSVDGAALDAGTYGSATAQVTGTSTVADYAGAMPWRDVTVMLSQQPPDITDLTVLPVVQPLTGVAEVCDATPGCVPDGLYYHEVAWSADTSLPAAHFGGYEVQRRDDIDTDWVTIARISCQGEPGFADFEARVGIESQYRARVLNSLDFAGDWSAAVASTVPAPGVTGSSHISSGVLMFTSNERQDGSINLAHVMAWSGRPEETFTFLEADQVTLQQIYNRDFQVAFRPLERGGESFSRTLLIQNAAIPAPSLGNFRSLRDMAWDTVPYVCVRDELGNRWLATVTVPSGTVRKNRTLYLAAVDITEVTATPSTVEPECETS